MTITLSERIRQCKSGVIANPYQGDDKKVVFVCSMGILRSATGSRIYGHKYNTRNAGTYEGALVPLTELLVNWADELVFVNRENFDAASKKYDLTNYNVKVLNIPDIYPHMHPEIIKAYEEQYEPLEKAPA